MNSLAVAVVLIAIFIASMQLQIQQTVNASHHHHPYKCAYPRTKLYVYTKPVQKECVLLMHNGHIVNATGAPIK